MLTILLTTASAWLAPMPETTTPECRIVRYASDGRRSERIGDPAEFGVQIRRGANGVTASARSSGSGQSSSSVSVSSSSSSSSRGSSNTRVDDGDRTISTHIEGGVCTVVIDERPPERRDR